MWYDSFNQPWEDDQLLGTCSFCWTPVPVSEEDLAYTHPGLDCLRHSNEVCLGTGRKIIPKEELERIESKYA